MPKIKEDSMSLGHRPRKAWWLLNHVPFDGCMLVFNANPRAWRTNASMRGRQLDVRFHVHNIDGGTRYESDSLNFRADLYITLEDKPRVNVVRKFK